MSDSDRDSPARRLTPSAYLTSRPARNPVSRPRSLYLSMPDGCRLAGMSIYLRNYQTGFPRSIGRRFSSVRVNKPRCSAKLSYSGSILAIPNATA
jgi:hypothetical protein